MRRITCIGLAFAAVAVFATPSSTTPAECAEGNCWMICEDALNRCLAEDGEDCFERYQECGLHCPM